MVTYPGKLRRLPTREAAGRLFWNDSRQGYSEARLQAVQNRMDVELIGCLSLDIESYGTCVRVIYSIALYGWYRCVNLNYLKNNFRHCEEV